MSVEKITDSPTASPGVRCRDLLCRWRETTRLLREWKDSEFPIGSMVYVDCPRYRGYGLVTADSECRDENLPVRLENGNVWWYPVDACTRIRDMKSLPRYARRIKLEFHGIYGLQAA